MAAKVLVIACGAIARELVRIQRLNGWGHVELQCLPPGLHNRPEKIPAAVLEKIGQEKDNYEQIFVGYADCGTGGMLDRALQGTGIERIPGAHCYEFFAGSEVFHDLADEEPGSFYLTDFLAQHFDQFVTKPLKFETHPELKEMYFGNYRRMVFISQKQDPELLAYASDIADKLDMDFEHVHVGYGELESGLKDVADRAYGG